MQDTRVHTFHIPVMGLAFSIDTPIKVARFGISSVVSIVDDILIEHMRKQHALERGETYTPITTKDYDYRARRITEYLNLLQRIVHDQIASLRASAFETGSEIVKYFEMLADQSPLKAMYHRLMDTDDSAARAHLEQELRTKIVAGEIDVNIMTKLDRLAPPKNGQPLPPEFSDALSSLRGFAKSDLNSSVVLSAGLNSRLFNYMAQFPDFLPDEDGNLRKRVTLKVSDYRSGYIQGKILAKKGIWVSEYRIESGLNCGGHAFASDGDLLGPILEVFKTNKSTLINELHELYSAALASKGMHVPDQPLPVLVTVQGGIGTTKEDEFLRDFYQVDGTGWGSPFLLVPEATNVDDRTRQQLAEAKREDFYISDSSPLGIPFNNVRNTTGEQQLYQRVEKGKPGSPCEKKFLCSNTEFTKDAICTASSQYQRLKIKQLESMNLPPDELEQKLGKVYEKTCLCEDLAATALNNNGECGPSPLPVAVCPGPNLAYFSRIATLEEMVGHIYGRIQLMTVTDRPSMFINEIRLNIDHLKNEIQKTLNSISEREQARFAEYKRNLLEGIDYYKKLIPHLVKESERYRELMWVQLLELEDELMQIVIPGSLVPQLEYVQAARVASVG
ncbi:MAG: hypothetical protein Q8P51_17895 [Ignavibacteria bacterium]|nr:hypothetical protein [Ignavibacteria bacterium]